MKNIFLTGEIQVGKSTLLNKVISNLKGSIGGFQTNRTVSNDSKEFFIHSLLDKNYINKIATILFNENKTKVIPYTKSFEEIADSIIRKSINISDVIVLDELGFLESNAMNFQKSIFEALDSSKLVIGVLKARSTPFLDKIRERNDVIIYEVNKENRDSLLPDILNTIST